MAKTKTTNPPITFRYGIAKIKTVYFNVNETDFINDPNKEAKVEISHLFGTNLNANLINLSLRVYFYYPESKDNILAEIKVHNIFVIEDLKQYFNDGMFQLPSQLLLTITSISISHTRALLSHNLASTAFQEFMLPITNPAEVAIRFFPSMFDEKTGMMNEFTPLTNAGVKLK